VAHGHDERVPTDPTPAVEGLNLGADHRFSKSSADRVELLAGLGVAGDVHAGATVRHRSRVAVDPLQPNLRQVHLIAGELLDELRAGGFVVGPGDLGENITTRGIDLLGLPTGAVLRVGNGALLAVTGLRNPCRQLDRFQPGLMKAVLDTSADGGVVRRAGVMAVVLSGGVVTTRDPISVSLPPGPPIPLRPV